MGWLEVDMKLTWRGHILRDKRFKQYHMAWNKGRNLSGPGLHDRPWPGFKMG